MSEYLNQVFHQKVGTTDIVLAASEEQLKKYEPFKTYSYWKHGKDLLLKGHKKSYLTFEIKEYRKYKSHFVNIYKEKSEKVKDEGFPSFRSGNEGSDFYK